MERRIIRSLTLPYDVWAAQIDDVLFYQDLRAILDGVECGELKKSAVTNLCKRNGAKFEFKTYSLKLLNQSLVKHD